MSIEKHYCIANREEFPIRERERGRGRREGRRKGTVIIASGFLS